MAMHPVMGVKNTRLPHHHHHHHRLDTNLPEFHEIVSHYSWSFIGRRIAVEIFGEFWKRPVYFVEQ
jgi:hypothetical protein